MAIKKILIYAEVFDGVLLPGYRELLSKAKEIFQGRGAVFAAAYAGPRNAVIAEELRQSGIHELYVMNSPLLDLYHPEYHLTALEMIVREADPDVLLITATRAGEEMSAALGVRLKTGVTAHCADLVLSGDGELTQMVPAFGGKVVGEIFTPTTRPRIASVKSGTFMAADLDAEECRETEVSAAPLDALNPSVEIVGFEKRATKKMPITAADVVICGGYGVATRENFRILEEVAEQLSGAIGGTRPALDAGWIEDESGMIGTSGRTVRPKVYIGFGVSGAAHHVCGIKDAGTIISVNQDPDAEIFEVSDYKAIGDARAVAQALRAHLARSGDETAPRINP
ncbi:MAG: electron transfer flavoprotein subunit alpha/FixB family protein [Clostridiales Family XIII bacterium]|nr:electron transfer flavoprotein subunit alpha/FixB family protein [Clostridiales Family XIII bacterium]